MTCCGGGGGGGRGHAALVTCPRSSVYSTYGALGGAQPVRPETKSDKRLQCARQPKQSFGRHVTESVKNK